MIALLKRIAILELLTILELMILEGFLLFIILYHSSVLAKIGYFINCTFSFSFISFLISFVFSLSHWKDLYILIK